MLAKAFLSSAESFVVMFILYKGVKNHNAIIVIKIFENARDFLSVENYIFKNVKKI
jgi:hypothetical protein